MLRRLILVGMLATSLFPLTTQPAAASAPIVNEHNGFTETFKDKICGVAGSSTIWGVDTFRLYADGTFRDTNVFRLVFTAANGNSVTLLAAGQSQGLDEPIMNDDGTLTFVVTIKGLGEKLSVTGGPTLALDAGTVTISTTFREAANGDLIFVSQELSGLHGPHPGLVSQSDYVCEVVVPALTA
jgi:hypothetical protein